MLGSQSKAILALAIALDCASSFASRAAQVLAYRPNENTRQASARRIGFLQWNLHAECFLPCNATAKRGNCDPAFPRCKNNAEALLQQLLETGASGKLEIDFAGVEQLVDHEFIRSSPLSSVWGQITHSCGGSKGEGMYPFDRATLFYRKSQWAIKHLPGGDSKGGCMETVWKAAIPNYRAFVMQAFQHRDTNLSVIVVVSHHPHVVQYAKEIRGLRDSLSAMREESGVDSVVLIADTNQPSSASGEKILRDIYPDAKNVSSTEIHKTCCYPVYNYPYDRIVAAGFTGNAQLMKTVLPFGDEAHHRPPPWVAFNMHDPVLGELSLDDQEQHSGAGFFASALTPWMLATALFVLRDCSGA